MSNARIAGPPANSPIVTMRMHLPPGTRLVMRTQPIRVGDRIGYSKAFLQSTGQYTGDVPLARGEVTGLTTLGKDTTLAVIAWDRPGLPERVNVKNLSTVRTIALGE